jgi:hypothetical protein
MDLETFTESVCGMFTTQIRYIDFSSIHLV